MSGKLTFLISLPRAGKTTFANKWVREQDPHGLPRVVVNADSLRLAFYGTRYNEHLEPMISFLKEVLIRKYLMMGYHVLVDGTHTSKASITKILSLKKDADFVVIHTSPEECKFRAIETDQKDLIEVIDRMHDNAVMLFASLIPEYVPFNKINLMHHSEKDNWAYVVNSLRYNVSEPKSKRIV